MAMTHVARPCQWCGAQSPATPLFEGRHACTRHLTELMAARARTAANDAALEAVAEAYRTRMAGVVPGRHAALPDLRAVRRAKEDVEWRTLVQTLHRRVYPVPASRFWTEVGVRANRRLAA